ncbi:MAG: hypothetical protein ACK2T7_04860 [Anaerolineales bacterium]
MDQEDQILSRRAKRLVHRLERLSADSSYAHQASGLRGALIRGLDARNDAGVFADPGWMRAMVEEGEQILIEAARQIPDSE